MVQLTNIRHGFASSHEDRELVSDNYLKINNCGLMSVSNIENERNIKKRPPRTDYMIVYFIEAGGYFDFNGEIYELDKGDLIYIEPGVQINVGVKNNSQHYWIHFTGKNIFEIMLSAGISHTGVYNVGYSSNITNKFADIAFNLFPETPSSTLRCNGIFLQLLSHISNRLANNNNKNNDDSIQSVLKHMNIFYYELHSLDFYAKMCGMSLSSFKHTFKKITSISPLAYLNTIRMENAKRLLSTTEMTISEISLSVGFLDPLYFSKAFKKYAGISPSEFRKQ